MFKKVYEEVTCPGNRFKMNHKLHDWTLDQSLLLLSNDDTGKSGLYHTRHILMSHTSHTVLITVLAVQLL